MKNIYEILMEKAEVSDVIFGILGDAYSYAKQQKLDDDETNNYLLRVAKWAIDDGEIPKEYSPTRAVEIFNLRL